uniref:Histone acetyltransferase type B catalytic subunit n=1 Tax=Lynceus sp. MCZ IZ 141354 TaxID=1930659 RepID=A0A9N6ZEK3_9CRUS|nr:EOG090X06NC [Lynceus sp. MCZ IZ 141354]
MDKLQTYCCDSNLALEFKLVRKVEDIENAETNFKPEMSHQVYGDQESIFGYKGLKIKLYYTACQLKTYLGVEYETKIDSKVCKGIEADEVIEPLASKLDPGFYTNLDDFIKALDKEKTFKPFGELVKKFSVKDRDFEVYYCNIDEPGFKSFHKRLQTFLLWYIDAASFIDEDDSKWCFFLLFEKFNLNGDSHYGICGYATVYNYYAYPNLIRPRISQFLVLPPFQKIGLGANLLNALYAKYVGESDVLDITVEDPSDDFIRLRDFVDVKNCLPLKSFQQSAIKSGFSQEMVIEAKTAYKLNKKQARRVYEILSLYYTNVNDPEDMKKFRLNIKNRLNVPFQKEQMDFDRLAKVMKPEELASALSVMGREQRLESLEQQYRTLEEHYRHILLRLEASN